MTPRDLRNSVLLAAAALAFAGGPASASDAAHPTVIELFQSQGCSSCPPAYANLIALSARPDVLALGFAVDYWDRLGWKDSFASPQFTRRQRDYARALGLDGVYTPQVVVNGRVEGVGAERADMERLAAAGDRGPGGPILAFAGEAATVGAGAAPAGGGEVWLARYNPDTLEISVLRGENAGRRLKHKNIVRELVRLGRWSGEAARYPLPPAGEPGLRDAILVQAAGQGPILAATTR